MKLPLSDAVERWIAVNEPWIADPPGPGLTRGVYFAAMRIAPCDSEGCGLLCGQHQPFVKIGFASIMEHRLAGIRTGCPYPISIVAMFDGTMGDERGLHRLFAETRERREWYRTTPELVRLVSYIEDQGGYYWREEDSE